MGFGEALGVAILITAFIFGLIYWIRFVIKKTRPDLKYEWKYKVMRKKYNEKEVERLLDYYQAGMSVDEVNKFLLVKGNISQKKAKEYCYIYRQIELKGGKKYGE
jgi:hypothetical protein